MSYYYQDNSYHHFPAPAYYDNTPSDPVYYEDTPSQPIYYNDTTSDAVYYNDIQPEPTYYDDTASEPTHYVDNPSYDELEAYAEAASNRTYYEDEIHPAYRDHPEDHIELEAEPPTIAELYYEDEIHPAYRHNPVDSHYVDSSYTITPLEVHVTPSPSPSTIEDVLFNCSDDDLTDQVQFYGRVLQGIMDRGFTPAELCDGSINSLQFDKYTRLRHQVETIQQQRSGQYEADEMQGNYGDEKGEDDKMGTIEMDLDNQGDEEADFDDENHHQPQPQSTPPNHLDFDSNIIPTMPPDILIPIPFPPSPNIYLKPTRLKAAFLIAALNRREPRYHFAPLRRHCQPNFGNKTRTRPPDTRPPEPHPISPNIRNQRPHFRPPVHRHPPDTLPPTPIPPKPNISIRRTPRQPRCPRRKHPPPLQEPDPLPHSSPPSQCHTPYLEEGSATLVIDVQG